MPWTDSHCHVDDERIPGGLDTALAVARVADVDTMIVVGTDADRSARAIGLAAADDELWATVGLHPHDAVEGVETIVGLLGAARVVAVGECGLDYHYEHSPRDVQRHAFVAQVAVLAHEHDLALVIHTREAWDDTFDVLAAVGVPPRTVFHCFTGGAAEARRAIDVGAFLSFSGIVTFKNADDVREAARLCPADRLLVETDAPYLAPAPHRGQRNQPAYVVLVGAAIAALRGVNVERIAGDTQANARVAFGLPSS